MDDGGRREVILLVLPLLVGLLLAVAAHPRIDLLFAAALIVSYGAVKGYLRYAMLAGSDILLRRLTNRFLSESEEVHRIAQDHGLTAHAYELRRAATSIFRKVSTYLRYSESRRFWATSFAGFPLLAYLIIVGSPVQGVDDAGNVTQPPPLWPTIWWLFVFAGCLFLFRPGSQLPKRQESLLETLRRSLVDLEDSTNTILEEAKQYRPKVYATDAGSMTAEDQEQMAAETRQAGGSMREPRLGPSWRDIATFVGFAVTLFAGALALFNSPKHRLLSAVITVVLVLLLFGLLPRAKWRG